MRTYEGAQSYVNINGQVIQDQVIQADYDGKNMEIDVYDKGKHFYSKLNNNDIASILSKKAVSMPLEKRLRQDFGINKSKSKKNKSKKNKSKKSKSKKSKGKSVRRKR